MTSKPKDCELEAVLCALYIKCYNSIHCHVPLEAVKAKLRRELWPILRRTLRELERKGLVYRKGGTKSYGLTREGTRRAREICFIE